MPGFLNSMVHFIQHFYFAHKAVFFIIFIGMVAGLLSQMILPGRGFGMIATILLGIAGAWIGHKFLMKYITFMTPGIMKEIVSATTGAMILAFLVNLFRGGKDRDKTAWRHN